MPPDTREGAERASVKKRNAAVAAGPYPVATILGLRHRSPEWARRNVLGHTVPIIVSVPKAVKSLKCIKGPNFQTLCVAAVVEDGYEPVGSTPEARAIVRAKYHVVYSLIGGIGVPPIAPPSLPAQVPVRF